MPEDYAGVPSGSLTDHLRIDESSGRFEIHKRVFTDEAIFKRERDIIFARCWLFIGHESELRKPKDFITRNVGGHDLIINRDRNGVVHAFHNVCTHRGTVIEAHPCGNANVFTCPYHGWVYDAEGKLRDQAAPYGYPDSFNEDGRYNLHEVPRLESYRGFYFINFNAKAIDLESYLGRAQEYLDLIVDQSVEGLEVIGGNQPLISGGNWKVLTDNQVDMYHGHILHSTYFEFVNSRTGKQNTASGFVGFAGGLGNGHNFMESTVGLGRPVAFWIPAFGEATKPMIEAKRLELEQRFGAARAQRIATTSRNMTIFPNLVIVDNVSISIRTMYPEEIDRVRQTIWAMGNIGEDPLLRDIRLRNHLTFTGPSGFAHPDDYEVFERIRQGNRNSPPDHWHDYSKGMLTDKIPDGDRRTAIGEFLDEAQQRAWWTQWDRVMAGAETLE